MRLRAGKGYLERAVQHLYPLQLSVDKLPVGPSKLIPEVSVSRLKRNAAEVACVVIGDQSHEEDNLPEVEMRGDVDI